MVTRLFALNSQAILFLPLPVKKSNASSGRVETQEERRLRKKREMKHRQQLRESQNRILQKTKKLASVHGSISASHMSDGRIPPLLSGDMTENRLKKPSSFHCKLK